MNFYTIQAGSGGYGGQGAAPLPQRGAGLGGGAAGTTGAKDGGTGSYATLGTRKVATEASGQIYGNKYLLPLGGGSGGGGAYQGAGGGGGGGAILIASDSSITLDGTVSALGGTGGDMGDLLDGGGGSGGGVRLMAPRISGGGTVNVGAGTTPRAGTWGGYGYIRLDSLNDQFHGSLTDAASRGFNPLLASPPQTASLSIRSVALDAVPVNPSGVLSTPDVTISAQQADPITVVVACANIPLNTPITVVVKPVNGATLTSSGVNNTGTQASSTATVSLNLPRGGGVMYATAAISN